MKLLKQQFLQIQTALLDGYDRASLRRMVRIGLDTSLDEIATGTTYTDIVFAVIEWAERNDKVYLLIQAAVEHNGQNRALQQLNQDASAWFAPGVASGETDQPPAPSITPGSILPTPQPSYNAGGDIIIATIGPNAKNVAIGKNIHQSTDDKSNAE